MTSTSDPSSTWVEHVISETYRREWGRLLSLLVARTRRLDPAEEALSEAFARASERWPEDGVPANAAGWLYTTAWRLILARLRSEAVAGRRVPLLAMRQERVQPPNPDQLDALADERLQLILLCCHPALPPESRSALALRLVIGTSTAQIARLFLVSPETMAARITRGKKKIVAAGVPLVSPAADELQVRLDEVCRTVYLAFTAGYTPGSGPDLLRTDLAGEAVELAAQLHRAVPHSTQARALLALLLLQHARRDARVRDGALVTLAEQDRSRWRRHEIDAGVALIDATAPAHGYAEELRLQALIAREHALASHASDTNWGLIASHYKQLDSLTESPIVRLNRAVAVAEADRPDAGLALLDGLETQLPNHHRVPAVRAELERRAGRADRARPAYARAIELCANDVERIYLASRLDSL